MEKSNAYYIRSAYKFQTAHVAVVALVGVKMIWQKNIPLKVVVFAWRLFQNRFPTKDNLFRRGAVNTDSCLCITGCSYLETVNHLFLHCPFFGSVWNCILYWVGLSSVAPFDVSDHFTQFSYGGGGSQVRYTILNDIWFATVWKIWKERNNRIFNDKDCSIMRMVDKIKSLSFSWLKEKLFSSLSIITIGGLIPSQCWTTCG